MSVSGTVQPTPTPPPTPTQYSYIISVSGSNYQILNGATMAMLYQGTSSSQVFNYLLGSSGTASNGNTVYVEAGAYSVAGTWNVYKANIALTFQSGAVLTAVNNFNNIILALHANGVTVSGVTINGNGANQSPAANAYVTGSNFNDGIDIFNDDCLIEYSTIYNCRCYGILSAYGSTADNVGVMNCKVYNCGANGISVSCGTATGTNFYIINNEVYGCGDVGIDSYGYDTIITGNYVHDIGSTAPMDGYNNAAWGIGIEMGGGTGSGKYLLIAGNTVNNCAGDGGSGGGIVTVGSGSLNNIIIAGNTIDNGGWAAIQLGSSSNDFIEYNTITNTRSGLSGGGSNNVIYGNTGISNNTSTPPSIVAVKVTSSPTGVGFVTANGVAGYAGSYSTSPYIFYATVANSVTLVANTVSGHSFASWSDGGAQSHTITVPSSYQTYTATYS
jgi:hypothetical protein